MSEKLNKTTQPEQVEFHSGNLYVKVDSKNDKTYEQNFNRAFALFKKKTKESGILEQVKENKVYTKKSERRRNKKRIGVFREKVRRINAE